MNKTIKDLVSGFNLYPIWIHQAFHVLSAKYKRTVFGTLWIAGQFVFTSLAFALVYGFLFHRNMHSYLPYAMLGNLAAMMCLSPMSEGPELYLGNAGIIKNYAYPSTYFSFEFVARILMIFVHNLIIFYLFMLLNGTLSVPSWEAIPGLAIDTVSLFAWTTLIGMMSARYRDLRFMLPNLQTLLFFLTPIYWPVDQLGTHQYIANFNPLYSMVSVVRMPLMGQSVPELNWLIAIGVAVVGVLVWFIAFSAYRRRIPFWI